LQTFGVLALRLRTNHPWLVEEPVQVIATTRGNYGAGFGLQVIDVLSAVLFILEFGKVKLTKQAIDDRYSGDFGTFKLAARRRCWMNTVVNIVLCRVWHQIDAVAILKPAGTFVLRTPKVSVFPTAMRLLEKL
jgi:hypothetical protein